MAAVVFPSTSKHQIFNPFHMASLQRSDDKLQVHPSSTASCFRRQESVAVGTMASQTTQDSPSTTFRNRLRSSFRSATRSRAKAPPTDDDEFGASTIKAKENKPCHDDTTTSTHEHGRDKGRPNMLKRLETKVGLRFVGRDSATAAAASISPVGDQRKENRSGHVHNADSAGSRVAGWTSFMTPSLRQASMSSPALHLQPPPNSQPAVLASSSSPTAGFISPSPDRTRRASMHPTTTRQISAPQPLTPRRELRNGTVSQAHVRSTSPRRPSGNRPSPISTTGHRSPGDVPDRSCDLPSLPDSPSPPTGPRGRLRRPYRQPGSANASQVSLSSQATSQGRGGTVSPTHARTPTKRMVTPTPNSSGFVSPSSTTLLTDAGSPSTSPTPPRRPSVDSAGRSSLDTPRRLSPEVPRRGSMDTQRKATASPPPRTASPAGTARSRATSPSQRTSIYAQSRHPNMSVVSLTSPSTPEQRELIRLATSVLCKELRKAPPHLSRPERQKEWAEVEVRLQPLIRVERIWGKSGALPGASSSQVAVSGVNSTVVSNAGEERERKLFCDALRDGVVLCQLMNKHRPNTITRVDPREDGFKRLTNITKFLAACSSQGVPSDDLFFRDDLIEATPETLCRVARTIVALPKLFETPTIDETKVITGQKKPSGTGTGPDSDPYSRSVSPLTSQVGPSRKRWNPPESVLPPLRSDSPPSGTSGGTVRRVTSEKERPTAVTDTNHDQECPIRVPSSPPKSHLRTQYFSKHADDSGAGLLSTIKPLEFPRRESISQCSSPTGDCNGDGPVRQSRTSSNLTENTAYSSIFDHRRNSNAQNKFGTIRTVTTEATSLGSEIPSFTRTEASSLAASLVEEMGRRRTISTDAARAAERRPSEPVSPDLVSLEEEEENSACGSSSRDTHRDNHKGPQANREVVRLGKGKWPDDFIGAFQAGTPLPISSPTVSDIGDPPITPLSVSPGRKLSIVTPPKPNDGSEPLPRRLSHRSRHSGDTTSILIPKELRTDASPDSPTPGGSRVILRRQSTRGAALRRPGVYTPRNVRDESEREGSPSAVPFPRAISGEHSANASPTPDTPRRRDRSISQDVSRIRGRFQSDIDDARSRRRSRPTSYDELGRQRRESDLPGRDSMDGSGVRQTIIVTEDGKPAIHYQLGNCIGRGQFGTVYRALNMTNGQMVAVKRIRLEGLKEEEVTQLMNEVDLMKSLSHPSIVKYEGMARDEGTLNIVLEYAESGSLGQTLKAFGKLNERLVASYVVKILEGLHYLHRCQVVHCDLKAANILTTKTGNVKLSDFGVSLNLRAMQREMDNVAGTPNWMAPEVIELKGASTKSDIWSLGCTVIELLTGRPPYGDITNSMTVMFRIVEDAMPPLPDECSDALQDFLAQCFNKDPELRPDAEALCEHPWLTSSWDALKDLRPQDSIPFLRRVSTDLHKADVTKLLAHVDVPIIEAPASESASQELPTPVKRRPSITPTSLPDDTSFTPLDHTFIKTTFAKPVVCRVCLDNMKKSAVICDKCSLVAHSKCAGEAPPTCDLRSQLLQYAEYAEINGPLGTPSNPVDASTGTPTSKTTVPSGEVSFVTPSLRPSTDLTSATPATATQVPAKAAPGLKFVGGLGRSRSSLSVALPSMAQSPAPVQHGQAEEKMPRKTPSKLVRNVAPNERPHSLSSNSTAPKSLRTADSRSSRQEPSGKSLLSAVEPNMSAQSQANAFPPTAERRPSRNFPGSIPQESEPQKKSRSDKITSCTIQ